MCTSPLYAVLRKEKDGSKSIKVIGKNDLKKFFCDNDYNYFRFQFKDLKRFVVMTQLRRPGDELIKLPCGQCMECRIEYARHWANRLYFESKKYADDEKFFITLTYDDEHIKKIESVYHRHIYSLRKKHVQDFMKRLRFFISNNISKNIKIRYFVSGEYGDHTHRPHYHLILFGFNIPDLFFYKNSTLNFPYYVSSIIESNWQHGMCVVARATWQTFNYCARYVIKKKKGQKDYYDKLGIEPEFCLMSRRPGIGSDYYDLNSDYIYRFDSIIIDDPIRGGFRDKPPRYFDKKLQLLNPDLYDRIKLDRKNSVFDQYDTSCTADEYDVVRDFKIESELIDKEIL